jgi:hypothetical protein
MRRVLGLVVAAVAATLFLALNAGQALAATVHCGDVITQDATLDADVLGCANPALKLARQDLTLDLNGHTVSNSIVTARPPDTAPEDQFLPAGNVTVKNGTVEGKIGFGFIETGTVRDTTSQGIEIINAFQALVTNNNVYGGGIAFAQIALADTYLGPSARVEHNVVSGGGIGFERGSFGSATDNRVTGSPYAGIDISRSNGLVTVADNVTNYNQTGISVYRSTYEIRDNTADHNVTDGIFRWFYAHGSIDGNHTWFNGRLGINGLFATPGSGNWAKHNGDARQCVNVACSTTGKPKG